MKSRRPGQRLHRILGLVLCFFLLYVSISGIILNHPELIAQVNVPRWLLPGEMRMKNWNRGAVLTAVTLEDGSTLLGGKLGVLHYDSRTGAVTDRSAGLPDSLYLKRVNVLHRSPETGVLHAGTASGLYRWEAGRGSWARLGGPGESIQSIVTTQPGLVAVSKRSALLIGEDDLRPLPFRREAEDETGVPLVNYLFDVHSGRVLGLPGRLLADMGGIALILLSLSGLVMWVFPRRLRPRGNAAKKTVQVSYRYHLRHYRKLGVVFLIPLISLPLSGLFLQPPFLIAVARARTSGTLHVDPPQATGWNDAITAAVSRPEQGELVVIAGSKMYRGPWDFSRPFAPVPGAVPVHPMGATALERSGEDRLLVGSFAGFLSWHEPTNMYTDLRTGERLSRPVLRIPKDGYQVNGLIRLGEREAVLDFHKGLLDRETGEPLLPVPEGLRGASVFSLWHFMFEVHNGRIWRGLVGSFYILHTMVVGLGALLVIGSGFLLVSRRRGSRRRGSRDG